MTLTGLTGKTSLKVLIVEDYEADARLMLEALREADFEPDWKRVETEADYLARLDQGLELILSDYNLPQFDAPRALALLHDRGLDIPFIIVSGSIGEDLAVNALKDGAADYLLKDRLGRLGQAVKNALAQKKLRESKRQLEEQFRQSQKMEAVGRLAGGVAHDFNNLLTVITGYTALALESLREGDPLRDDVLEISKAASRAASLTRQLLAFSRRQILAPAVVDFNTLLGGMEKLIERLIGEDVDLSMQPAPGLWPMKVDQGQMEQVVMNLVVNSRDAMPGGGRLTIETANVELDESYAATHPQARPGEYVRLAVTDSGCGMDAATCARIFEPFFTTKGVEHGTGLGLATVYGIVTQSGGHIEVYSEPGLGSTFKIYVPRTSDAATGTAHERPPPREAAQGTETVLLVEDEEEVRTLARKALEKYGYTVIEAPHPHAALRQVAQAPGPVHILVTDVVMPNMSGRQLAERLQPARPDMRVLYISGYTDDAVVRNGILEATMPFLSKPFTPDALVRKIRHVLDAG